MIYCKDCKWFERLDSVCLSPRRPVSMLGYRKIVFALDARRDQEACGFRAEWFTPSLWTRIKYWVSVLGQGWSF